MNNAYKFCTLCARRCGVDRTHGVGFCGMPEDAYISRAALHMWEEPIISGARGSGTVFFSGCSLKCCFCQNREISRGRVGKPVTSDELAQIMLKLESDGAHNVNFVTPTHYIPTVREAIITAKSLGLSIPIVYNTSSYDTPDALKTLEGLVDIYLPDFKYFTSKTAEQLSSARDYPDAARSAIAEMVRQTGSAVLGDDGLLTRGTVVRILLLPGHVAEAKLVLKYLYDTYGDSIYISLMNQYTPPSDMPPPLNRTVTHEEYRQLTDYALKLGVKNAFVQEWGTASESFIPDFNLVGLK